ncbi:hypothetical protein PAAG_02305 [Paracoccidioides lutzii Pb01]|uniref:Uncharacterized protein n=1 Tax=Paracoccidioides lutzii (strain ATCC MYA-826 / Pb01) TaxID=502779 RepID=C1GVM8_PARBA|nr:hypothetical protein PAAG_02305 [Paracoccidioides lutzii Pb01]EEH40250.2 hypothetical protein PAAG_02305 [Paracoccidioides lutzii Pb01]
MASHQHNSQLESQSFFGEDTPIDIPFTIFEAGVHTYPSSGRAVFIRDHHPRVVSDRVDRVEAHLRIKQGGIESKGDDGNLLQNDPGDFHRAIVLVLKLSGTGEYVENILRDVEEVEVKSR